MKTRVKELRTAAKMTQQQLADLVHVTIQPLSYAGLQNGSGVWGDNRGFMLLKGEQRIGGQKV